MDPVIGGLLAGTAVGGMDLFGGLLSQSTSKQIASDNRRFIRDMYKKRYQLTMKDMQKAGLNPVLAMNGGNVGSVPSPGSFPSVDNILGSAANSAMSAAQSVYGMRKTDADISRTDASTKSINQDVISKTIKNKYLEPQEEAMVKDAMARATNNTALAELNSARVKNAEDLAQIELGRGRLTNDLLVNKNMSSFYDYESKSRSPEYTMSAAERRWLQRIKLGADVLGKGVSSAVGVGKLRRLFAR